MLNYNKSMNNIGINSKNKKFRFMVKKVVAVMLLFSLVLCGCGKDSDSKRDDDDKEKKTKETKDSVEDKEKFFKRTGKTPGTPDNSSDSSSDNANGWMVGYIDEIERIVNEHEDVLFNLLDVNGDSVPELVSFNSEGYWANISVYKDNQVVTQVLYDNGVTPAGFTDYGAYGYVIGGDNSIIIKEIDTTFDRNGGWNTPGSEWIGIPAVPFESYEYLTFYELNDDLELEETGKCYIHFHYNKPEKDEDEGPGEREFVEATYDEGKISENEYYAFLEITWFSDVYFGSGQDMGEGLRSDEMIDLLSDETFVFEPGVVYKGTSDVQEVDIEPVYAEDVVIHEDYALKIVAAEATSELNVASKDNATYHPSNLYDGDSNTAWVEGVQGDGEGESITLYLDGVHSISSLSIYNGFLKTQRRYAINGKVSKVIIDYGNGYEQVSNVGVIYPPEEEVGSGLGEMVYTPIYPEVPVETDTIKITIVEAVPGSQYHDTAISEIMVFGQ